MEAAIASVEGTVIGGWNPAGSAEGLYAVQVSDTTSVEGLRANRTALRLLPQVKSAIYFPLVEATYLRPHDGSNWQKAQWSLTPNNVPSSPRWALEAIAAPAAWGCSKGEHDANVMVADVNFDNVGEVTANLRTPLPAFGQNPSDVIRHGTGMTSTIAARGNDSVGMTGVMWKAQVKVLQVPGSSQSIKAFPALGMVLSEVDGSDTAIVNLSWGHRWTKVPTQQDSTDHARAWGYIADYFKNIQPMSPNALLIIAAGNQGSTGPQGQDSLDAWWAGLPILADSLPGRVLVVGSSTINQTRAKFSSLGTRPDIYAPGKDVYSYNRSALTIAADSGDSYANAYVTGVAGLLKSFDPRLTGPQIRNFLLEGADSGNRVITNGKKLLNAYEALKAAARRPGAPLCGNQIWIEGDKIKVDRNGAAETLLDADEGLSLPELWHGGKRISYDAGGDAKAAVFSNGSWIEAPALPHEELRAAGFALSHDQDRFVAATTLSSLETIDIIVADTGETDPDTVHITSMPARAPADSPQLLCIIRWAPPPGEGEEPNWTCADSLDLWWGVDNHPQPDPWSTAAFHPKGDTVFITRTWTSLHDVAGLGWNSCNIPDTPYIRQCQQVSAFHRVDSTTVYKAPIATGAALTRLFKEEGYVGALSIGEASNGDIVTNVQDMERHILSSGLGWLESEWETTNCRTHFVADYADVVRTVNSGACWASGGWLAPVRAARKNK